MTFWQEHIPQPNLPCSGLQLIDDGRIGSPSFIALAQLSVEDGVGGDAFLLDELVNLQEEYVKGRFDLCFSRAWTYQVQCLLCPVADLVTS